MSFRSREKRKAVEALKRGKEERGRGERDKEKMGWKKKGKERKKAKRVRSVTVDTVSLCEAALHMGWSLTHSLHW